MESRICQFALSRDIKKKGIFICSEVEPLSFPHTAVLGDESRQTVWSAHILTCKSIDFFLSLFPSLSPSFQYYSICSTQAERRSKGNIFLLFMRNVFRCWTIDIVLAFQVEEIFRGTTNAIHFGIKLQHIERNFSALLAKSECRDAIELFPFKLSKESSFHCRIRNDLFPFFHTPTMKLFFVWHFGSRPTFFRSKLII